MGKDINRPFWKRLPAIVDIDYNHETFDVGTCFILVAEFAVFLFYITRIILCDKIVRS